MKAPWTCLPPVNSHSHPHAGGTDAHRISTIYCARVRKRKLVGKGNLVSDDVIGQRRAASIALRAHKAQSVSTVRKNWSATHGPKILTGLHQIWLHCTKIPPCCLLPFNFTSPFVRFLLPLHKSNTAVCTTASHIISISDL